MLSYDSSSIKILKGLEAVRQRPGMYIGDTYDGTGLHHMVFEIIDNSVDEYLAGFCKNIFITLHKDDSISVLDDGRGIPTDVNNDTGISGVELIMTILHSGSKFDNNSYKISGGLHGVGISVVNALSKKLELKIYRENKIFYQIYYFGVPKKNVVVIGETKLTGTYIRFWPDKKIFSHCNKFNFDIICKRLKELSYLNNGLYIKINNKKNNNFHEFLNYGGIKFFLSDLVKNKKLIHKNIFYFNVSKKKIFLEVACQWIDSFKNKILCFTNNIPQVDGGSHLIGFKSAITRTLKSYIEKNLNKKKNNYINGEDTRVGLFAIIVIKMFNPKFSSQTKEKLISSEVKKIVESLVNEKFLNFLLNNISDSKNIVNKIIYSCKIRESLKKSRELSRKKNIFDFNIIASKLASCQEKNPVFSEIFLVEGDSAGGSAKQGRNRVYQAVLPLKGKIINVEKTSLDKILFSKEISILVSVLGCGIGGKNFNLSKLRYHNIIIMTDADVDGAHIRTLLLTFFYRYMPDLIKYGYLYIARPPLYRINEGKKEFYIKNYNDLLKYKIFLSFKKINLYKKNKIILLKNKYLVYFSYKYKCLLNDFNKLETKFSNYIFDKIMFFKSINITNINDIKEWLNDFSFYLNKYFYLENKIFCKLILKKNIFLKIKIFYFNEINKEIIYINSDFFKEKYFSVLNLGKKLFFFKKEYKKFIIINNKKIYFNNLNSLINFVLDKNKKKIFIQHYKGLGEMNPIQLWDTTMNPKKRVLSKVFIDDFTSTDKLFRILMGDDINSRKKFIKDNFMIDLYKNI